MPSKAFVKATATVDLSGYATTSAMTAAMAAKADASAMTTALAAKADASAMTTALAAKAPIASPTFTGTVSGITKAHVGLGNVDNTADSAKPVSTAQAAIIPSGTYNSVSLAKSTSRQNTFGKTITVVGNFQTRANSTVYYEANVQISSDGSTWTTIGTSPDGGGVSSCMFTFNLSAGWYYRWTSSASSPAAIIFEVR